MEKVETYKEMRARLSAKSVDELLDELCLANELLALYEEFTS